MAFEPVRKIEKESANCAIFGAISISGSPLSGQLAVKGICEAEAARGGTYGNGVMLANAERGQRGKTLCVWAKKETFTESIKTILQEEGVAFEGFERIGQGEIYTAHTEIEYLPLILAVTRANSEINMDDARVISFGHGISLFKGLESLSKLDEIYGLSGMPAMAMIAHTRYPTGSQPKVARAHPFSYGNVGIVHNGDVTSYRANLGACEARLAEIYHLYSKNGVEPFFGRLRKSWAGTDSEVIAGMIYTMLKTGLMSEPGLGVSDIMSALVPPFDNNLTRLLRGSNERERLEKMAFNYKGFGLDGPVSSIALMTYEDDVQLIAFRDRNTFRPLQIVIDRESGRVFVASELRQIIASTGIDIFSSKVESYSPEPGKFLWVSSKYGIREPGRNRRPFIAVPNLDKKDITGVINGQPHQFAGNKDHDSFETTSLDAKGDRYHLTGHKRYVGTLGSHGFSYSDGDDATVEIVGSVQDNCLEASSIRRVICHANASMMLANAFQGEQFFLRGSVDSRAFQQLRPKNGRDPVAIIGETAGQYLGKMMSGGTIMVLGLEYLGMEDVDNPIAGEFLGTGMVGGKVYVRGHMIEDFIKRPPQRIDVIAACSQLKEEGLISESALRKIRHTALDLQGIEELLDSKKKEVSDPDSVKKSIDRLSQMFDHSLLVERRLLNAAEIEGLGKHLKEFFDVFGLSEDGLKRVLASHFTIVGVKNV